MTMYYSASLGDGKGGFCPDTVYGKRLIDVIDEAKQLDQLRRARDKDQEEFEDALAAERGEEDPTPPRESFRRRERMVFQFPPMMTVDNPVCRLPADAVEVEEAEYYALMQMQADGQEIKPGPGGHPIARPREITAEQLLAQVRAKRDRELTASDWTQTGDSPLSAAKKKLWADHRKALRDLPKAVEALLKEAETAADVDLMAIIPQPPQ